MHPLLEDESPTEECGIAAVYLKKDLSHYPKGGALFFLQKMLLQLQHRGQLSAGFTIFNDTQPERLKTYKANGLVNEVFHVSEEDRATKLFDAYSGRIGIGHTRYATSGGDSCDVAQPFERVHSRLWKWFSFAFNGNVANAPEIRNELKESDYHFRTNTDTEVLMHLLAHHAGGETPNSLENMFTHVAERADGAYSIAYVNARGELCIMRDKHGFKPLVYVDTPDFFLAASESVALHPFVKSGVQDVKAGELVRVHENKIVRSRFAASTQKVSHCMFEWVYFASAGSTMQGSNVYETRWRLGVELARTETLATNSEDWVVVNVPDTSKPAADGYAFTLKLPAKEGLLRNRYVGRTFIEGGKWQDKVKEKFTINKSAIEGKNVILVEDSIVRGSTMRELVQKLKEEGHVLSVHARISCPPILNPCFYGIDMTTFNELIAAKHAKQDSSRETVELSPEEMSRVGKELGTDSLRYQTVEGLYRALQLDPATLCAACLTGKYPTPTGQSLVTEAWFRHQQKIQGRVYDR